MDSNRLVTRNDERVASFFKSLDKLLGRIEKLTQHNKPTLNGERYLTDREVSGRLKISKRTLQEYRNDGRLPYYKLGGKILYRESDLQRLLETNYKGNTAHKPCNCW